MIYSSQVAERLLKTVTSDRCYETKRGQGEMSDKRRPTNEIKQNKQKSFIGKLGSDLPSSPECSEALRPLDAPTADQGIER